MRLDEEKVGTCEARYPIASTTMTTTFCNYVNKSVQDVLLGRGGGTNNHPGNQQYLQDINEFLFCLLDVSIVNCSSDLLHLSSNGTLDGAVFQAKSLVLTKSLFSGCGIWHFTKSNKVHCRSSIPRASTSVEAANRGDKRIANHSLSRISFTLSRRAAASLYAESSCSNWVRYFSAFS